MPMMPCALILILSCYLVRIKLSEGRNFDTHSFGDIFSKQRIVAIDPVFKRDFSS